MSHEHRCTNWLGVHAIRIREPAVLRKDMRQVWDQIREGRHVVRRIDRSAWAPH
jgi:hypothetical protein